MTKLNGQRDVFKPSSLFFSEENLSPLLQASLMQDTFDFFDSEKGGHHRIMKVILNKGRKVTFADEILIYSFIPKP
jgi:hypothetical protein